MGSRGGISVITHKKGEANNEYMPSFDEDKEIKFVSYLDSSNLYGWTMSQYLPYEGFEWLEVPETFNVHLIMKDSNIGHIFEVDVEYLEELHDLHNEYPYCDEGVVVKEDMLLDYCSAVAAEHNPA